MLRGSMGNIWRNMWIWGVFRQSVALLLLLCALAAPAARADDRPGAELVATMLRLYRDENQDTRLYALLLSAGLAPHKEIVEYLRTARRPVFRLTERVIMLYALGTMTRAPEDIEAFLDIYLASPCAFFRVFSAEWNLCGIRHGIAHFLLTLAYEKDSYREKALRGLLTFVDTFPEFLFIWHFAEDPLVLAYREENPGTHNKEIPDTDDEEIPGAYSYDMRKRDEEAWNCRKDFEPQDTVNRAIYALLESEDDITRISALGMVAELVDIHEDEQENALNIYARKNRSLPEQVLFSYQASRYGEKVFTQSVVFDGDTFIALFPEDRQAVEDVFALENSTYNAINRNMLNRMQILAEEGNREAARKLSLALQYAGGYFTRYEYQDCERFIKEFSHGRMGVRE